MIEQIKEPCANRKRSTFPFRYRKCLLHAEVSVEVAWTAKLVTALSSEIACRVREVSGAVAWIIQLRSRIAAIDVSRAHHVGQYSRGGGGICTAERRSLQSRSFVTAEDGIREPSVLEDGAGERPAFH